MQKEEISLVVPVNTDLGGGAKITWGTSSGSWRRERSR